ncbi:MAG: DUF2628 domain-containing protein [Thermodesulfobacteriota bacterium]
MTYCENYGHHLVEEANFCPKCGTRIIKTVATPSAPMITEEEFNLYVGRNSQKYVSKFSKFESEGGDRFALTWNWAAFCFSFYWLLYRRLYLMAAIAIAAILVPGLLLLVMPLCGMTGNYIYYRHAKKNIIRIRKSTDSHITSDIAKVLSKASGVNYWAVLVVILIGVVGYFGSIAIPRIAANRINSYNFQARSYLENACKAQQALYLDNNRFTSSLEELLTPRYGLSAKENVELEIILASKDVFIMSARHSSGDKKYEVKGPFGIIKELPLGSSSKRLSGPSDDGDYRGSTPEGDKDSPSARLYSDEMTGYLNKVTALCVSLRDAYFRDLNAIGWERILDPLRIQQDKSLSETSRMIQTAKALIGNYRSRSEKILREAYDGMDVSGRGLDLRHLMKQGMPERILAVRQVFGRLWELEELCVEEFESLFAFLSTRRKAWSIVKGQILFKSASDLDKFNTHRAVLQAYVRELQELHDQTIDRSANKAG